MSSTLIYHLKEMVKDRYVLEQKIFAVDDFRRFPDGIKYRLVFIDTETDSRVLMDNHHPKGHHIHLDNQEFSYLYLGVEQLVEDFKKYIFQHLGVRI